MYHKFVSIIGLFTHNTDQSFKSVLTYYIRNRPGEQKGGIGFPGLKTCSCLMEGLRENLAKLSGKQTQRIFVGTSVNFKRKKVSYERPGRTTNHWKNRSHQSWTMCLFSLRSDAWNSRPPSHPPEQYWVVSLTFQGTRSNTYMKPPGWLTNTVPAF